MKDKYKKKDVLVRELAEMRERLAELAADASDSKVSQERTSRFNAILRAARNVWQLAATETDRDSLLRCACAEIVQSAGFHNAWIAILDDSGKLVSAAEAGFDEAFSLFVENLKQAKLPGCCQRALAESRVVVTEDPSTSCGECPLSGSYWGTGAMTRRLEHLGKVYGLLTGSADASLIVEEEILRLFDDTADAVAHALHILAQSEEKNLHVQTLSRARWQLEVMNRVAETILTSSNNGICRSIVEILMEATASRVGLLGYIDDNGALVVPLMTSDASHEAQSYPSVQVFPENTWGDTAGARALREQRTVFSNDPCSGSALGLHHIRRHISQPVVHQEKVVGLLQVANKDTDYEQEDIDLLQGVSVFLAPALAAMLQDAARRQAEAALPEADRESEAWAHWVTSELGRLSQLCEQRSSSPRDVATAVSAGRRSWEEQFRRIISFASGRMKPTSKQSLKQGDSPPVVLIVGQPASFSGTIKWVMRDLDRKAVVAADEDGEAALTTARSVKPAVIVVHLKAAGMRRFNTMCLLREEFPAARIIAVSPWDTKSIRFSARESGADQLVVGSNPDRDLVDAIRRALSRHA